MIRRLYLGIALLFSTLMLGQIPSADLICANNNSQGVDSLEFMIPPVVCGAITSVNVYQSNVIEGPYVLVLSTADPMLSALEIPNPANDTFFYYLEIEADCPGQSPTPSDTLSNLPPPVISIERVSVLANNDVSIRWVDLAASNPKVEGYVIYRVDVGTNAIDTLFGSVNEYIDTGAEPEDGPVFYYVQAIDGCGVLGPIGNNPHNTIHVETEILSCERSMILRWTPYGGWSGGVDSTIIWLSVDNAPEFELGSTNLDSFVVPNLQANIDYSLRVESVEQGTGIVSSSQQINFDPVGQISQGITRLEIWGASVEIDGIQLYWDWNADAQLAEANINSTNQGYIQPILLGGLQTLNEQFLIGSATNGGPVSLWIETLDQCDTTQVSDTVATAFLQVLRASDFTNQISTTPPRVGIASQIEACDIIRYVNDVESTRIPLASGQSNLNDDPGMLMGDEEVCYQMECIVATPIGNGITERRTLKSNIACPKTEVQIQVPNAFRPAGTNRFFRPLFLFENAIQSYQLSIFDRYGKRVFETDDIQQGWDGTIGNQPATGGVYVFRIQLTQNDGQILERSGEVMLIR